MQRYDHLLLNVSNGMIIYYLFFVYQKFDAAAEKLKTFTKRPTDQEFLEIYALFKQGTMGDNNSSKPGLLDFKGKAKWEAWESKKGMSSDAAKEAYIALIERLSAAYQ